MNRGIARAPDGARLHWERRGSRRALPLLLIRPLGGSSALWGAFRDELARTLNVVSYDFVGMGESRGRVRTTTRALARDAWIVAEAVGLRRTAVFGPSLGGMVATHMAGIAPRRVYALVLASTTVSAAGARLRKLGELASRVLRAPGDATAATARSIVAPRSLERAPDLLSRVRHDAQRRSSNAAVAALLAAAARHNGRAALRTVRAPTLVLYGDHDPLVSPAAQADLVSLLSDVSFDLVLGAGHDLALEEPIETAQRTREFVTLAARASSDAGTRSTAPALDLR